MENQERIKLLDARKLDGQEFEALEDHLRGRHDYEIAGTLEHAADRQSIPPGEAA